jgi:hypothetical protein
VLKKIFELRRGEVTGGWRELHNEEFHNMYFLPIIIRMMKSRRIRWVEHTARMGEKKTACRLLVTKPEEKRPLGR